MKSKLFFVCLFLFFTIQLNAEEKTEKQNFKDTEYLAQSTVQKADTVEPAIDPLLVIEESDDEKRGTGRKVLFVTIIILLALSFIGFRFSKYKE